MDEGKDRASEAELYNQLVELYKEVDALESAYKNNRLLFYRTPHSNRAAFHAADVSDIRLAVGGNRSGKTTVGVVEAISHSLGYRPWLPVDHPNRIVRLADGSPIPVPNVGRVIAENFETNVVQTIWPKFQEWLPAGSLKPGAEGIKRNPRGVPVRLEFANGSIVHFMSYDQDTRVFEGPNGHWVWCDEPPPQDKFEGLRRGLIDYNGHAWITMTPLVEPWINEVIYDHANEPGSGIYSFKWSIWENCKDYGGYLDRRAIESYLATLPPEIRATREFGDFLHLAGRVFPDWMNEPPYWIDPFEIPKVWPRVVVIDPHPQKPIAVLWIAISPDNQAFIYRSLFDSSLKTVEEVADVIKEAEGWRRLKDGTFKWQASAEKVAIRIIDTSANENERTSGLTVKNSFANEGIICVDAQKRNRNAGINAIREALRCPYEWSEPGLVVFNTCPEVKQNFLNYIWPKATGGRTNSLTPVKTEPVKVNDDFIDCIRYYYQSGLDYERLCAIARINYNIVAGDDDDEDEDSHFSASMKNRKWMWYGRQPES